MIHGLSEIPDVSDTGRSPYTIIGDPMTALIAQLNRFAGKSVNAGGACGSRRFVVKSFVLAPAINSEAAQAAAAIVVARHTCIPSELQDRAKVKWALDGFQSNTWAFVMNNLAEITATIAQFGDMVDLAPAVVGITKRDPRLPPLSKFPTLTVMALGVLVIAAIVVSQKGKQ